MLAAFHWAPEKYFVTHMKLPLKIFFKKIRMKFYKLVGGKYIIDVPIRSVLLGNSYS